MLKVGDKAPDFSAIDQDGNEVTLSGFAGKQLVLYFYPKDNTPGCTAEACNLRDNYHRFLAEGYAVVGVSKDSPASHKKFIEKFALPFPLVADTEGRLTELYDAWGEKSMYGKKYMGVLRKTFVIDPAGVISQIIEKVESSRHTAQILP